MQKILEIKQSMIDDSMTIEKLREIHLNSYKILKEMKSNDNYIINSILHKSLSKLQNKCAQKKSIENNLITIKFIKFEENLVENYIEYIVNVNDNILNKTWQFKTRFSQLYEFHKNLEESFYYGENNIFSDIFCVGKLKDKMPKLPEFPEKSWIENKKKEFLKIRMKNFENYFQELICSGNYKEILDSGIVTNFFYGLISDNLNKEGKKFSLKMKNWIDIKSSVIFKNNFHY